jgi:hypothetical protein
MVRIAGWDSEDFSEEILATIFAHLRLPIFVVNEHTLSKPPTIPTTFFLRYVEIQDPLQLA